VPSRRPERGRLPRALTIAGSDSGAGAGVQADLKTFQARGVYGTCAITALTAQSTRGVHAVRPVPPAFVRAQIDAVVGDLGADATKIGMLVGAATVRAVAAAVARHRLRRVVLDPVLVATSGTRLLAAPATRVLRARLLPLVEVVTPNLAEAAALAGFPVVDLASMRAAARVLRHAGARAVVISGGHLPGDAIDLLLVGTTEHVLRATRVPIAAPHGTGCTFSAAIAAELAKGADVETAVRTAKRYTTACIRRARRLGGGHPILGH
jgi:hydroxymethylpyrimidine/phosphomethylpyrimidine kinase